MKKQRNKTRMVIIGTFCVFVFGMIVAVFGLSRTVSNIDKIAISKEPEAILASAGVTSGMDVSLPVAYYDQKADPCVNMYDDTKKSALEKRQFEWTACGYEYKQLEQGMVKNDLNEKYLPVAVGGDLTPNKGLKNMDRWFASVDGKSKEYSSTLQLAYTAEPMASFVYSNDNFYPLDEAKFSVGDGVNTDGHNHLFTMNFAIPFTVTASGNESFEITADDDTFVYVGTKLALDMGGIHDALSGKLTINESGEVYTGVGEEDLAFSGIQVAKDEGAIVRIFHADRDSANSMFEVKFKGVNLNVVQTQLADAEGVQVAYDPTDPSYVAPLGETKIFRPDGTRSNVIMATVLGVVILICSVFTVILAHTLVKERLQKK